MPVPLSHKYKYTSLFSDICRSRFNHLVTRFIPIIGLLFTLTISILFGSGYPSYFRRIISSLLYKFPILYLLSLLLVFMRKNYLHVNYDVPSNIITSVFRRLFSIKAIAYLLSNILVIKLFAVFFQDLLSISLNHILLTIILPATYTIQHVLFDLDRLPFKFEIQHQPPSEYIYKKLKAIVIKSLILAITIMTVILFGFATLIGKWTLGFYGYVSYFVFTFVTLLYIEFINLSFTAHMIIGCIHKGKLISSLSATPVETLISGLSSNKSFTKMTAFQELCYRAISMDSSLRTPIYQARLRNNKIWPAILNECIILTKSNNTAVSQYMLTLQNSLKPASTFKQSSTRDFLTKSSNDEIFGNDKSIRSDGQFDSNGFLFNNNFEANAKISNNQGHPNRIAVRTGDILINNKRDHQTNLNSNKLFNNTHLFDEPIITHKTKFMLAVQKIWSIYSVQIKKFFTKSQENSESQTLSILETLNISKIRIAERLVPMPVTQGYCIIALMGLFIHALDEDPKGSIVSSVGDVLKLLERSVGSLGRYADWKPDYTSNLKNDTKKIKTLDNVSKLYELSINVFLEVVLKYNVLLNDVYLDKDVIILSKWVLEMCNDEI
ncbi:hypothetical protein TPHA_0K00300 [Tetrapisispora phaffii CBS 4417]|uniref:Nucleoporin NDC1 n=1 Tax=Tetrapisispora phaffii (strain ATCC 24235 / CBS 4417 / NBRC 1672 / NRRL Y-8282 / UCD 70-5) TaxID=1071381 RepID=G8BZ36_TETPH|nr:hypothetical protein TPHA_0K00300 [Tetrapisispora phaffii CBS 4417]CCE65164.1 hypothetical protein TPHA_0K00300 [Tetrapisispora phaffii CBS 4417]